MRIVIDGSCGSGKTTFLTGNQNNGYNQEANIRKLGYTVFSELIQGSINEGEKLGISPPKSDKDWMTLLNIMITTGRQQYESGSGNNIYWYDRGIPFISVFAHENNVSLPPEIYNSFKLYTYDYVFVFKPIESYDLSGKANGKLREFTLEDRYNSYNEICDLYTKLGLKIHEVPVFSNDIHTNFVKRFEYIKNIVTNL